MIRLVKYLKDHFAEIARAVIVAAIYFVLAYLVDSPARLAISFLAVTVLLVIGRVFYPSGLEDDLEELEGSVEKMAEGNLSVFKPTLASSSAVIRDFSTRPPCTRRAVEADRRKGKKRCRKRQRNFRTDCGAVAGSVKERSTPVGSFREGLACNGRDQCCHQTHRFRG